LTISTTNAQKSNAFLLQSHKRALLIADVTGSESKDFLSAKIKRFCINFHDGVAQESFQFAEESANLICVMMAVKPRALVSYIIYWR